MVASGVGLLVDAEKGRNESGIVLFTRKYGTRKELYVGWKMEIPTHQSYECIYHKKGMEVIYIMSFQYVQPTDAQKELMQHYRDGYEALAEEVKKDVSPSRGLSLAMTKLEESAFWLNKAITENDK